MWQTLSGKLLSYNIHVTALRIVTSLGCVSVKRASERRHKRVTQIHPVSYTLLNQLVVTIFVLRHTSWKQRLPCLFLC